MNNSPRIVGDTGVGGGRDPWVLEKFQGFGRYQEAGEILGDLEGSCRGRIPRTLEISPKHCDPPNPWDPPIQIPNL